MDDIDLDDMAGGLGASSPEFKRSTSQHRFLSNSPSPNRHLKATPTVQEDLSGSGSSEHKNHVKDEQESEIGTVEEEDTTRSSLDSNLSQYQKDLQRLKNTINGKPKAFSKARMGDSGALTLENLRRKNGSNESLHSSRSGSFSLIGSEPGVNVPKAWGRKSRPSNDWLNRIHDRKSRPDAAVIQKDDHVRAGSQEPGVNKSIDDWMAAAAEVPLPHNDKSSSMLNSSSQSTPRDRAQKQIPTNARHSWNIDDDFTGRSLQISDSPPLRIRNGLANIDTHREIKSIQKQAVTTNRLGELKERLSESDLKAIPARALSERHPNTGSPLQGLPELRRIASDPSADAKPHDKM